MFPGYLGPGDYLMNSLAVQTPAQHHQRPGHPHSQWVKVLVMAAPSLLLLLPLVPSSATKGTEKNMLEMHLVEMSCQAMNIRG